MWSRRTSTPEILRSGEVLQDQTHCELVYRPLQFHKRSQLFIGVHNQTLSVVALYVGNPDRSPFVVETEPCQLAVFSGELPSMEAEIDCKLQSNSS
jgi:hypothetical protein